MPDPIGAAAVHQHEEDLLAAQRRALGRAEGPWREAPTALCLSGGGIRSASFAIGFLQAFAERRLVRQFDYLSGVSGGGYAVAWWSALTRRVQPSTRPPATEAAQIALAQLDATEAHFAANRDAPDAGLRDPFERRYVRAHGNYLTVRSGLLSSDTWAAIFIMLRNLLYGLCGPGALALMLCAMVAGALGRFDAWLAPEDYFYYGTAACFLGWLFTSLRIHVDLVLNRELLIGGVLRPPARVPSLLLAFGVLMLSAALDGWSRQVPLPALELPPVATVRALVAALWPQNDLALALLLVCLALMVGNLVYVARHWRHRDRSPFLETVGLLLAAPPVAIGCVWLWLAWKGPIALPTAYALVLLYVMAEAWILGAIGTLHGLPDQAALRAARHIAHALAVPIGVLAAALLPAHLTHWVWSPVTLSRWVPTVQLALLLALAGATFCALVVIAQGDRTRGLSREWWARWSGHLLLYVAACAAVFLLAALGRAVADRVSPALLIGASLGCMAIASARADSAALRLVLRAFGMASVALAAVLAFAAAASLDLPWWAWALVLGIALAVLAASGPNTFSMHELYRHRLVHAFLGASNPNGQPTGFIGLCPDDDLPLRDLNHGAGTPLRPYPIWSAALNVTSTRAIGLQERRAASFVFSPLYCGYELQGAARPLAGQAAYAPTADHGDDPPLTVGSAMATSGAAFSSNTGATTQPERALILTLLGIRLGHWFANPARPDAWHAGAPIAPGAPAPLRLWRRLLLLFDEAFASCDTAGEAVYVSDGGHFENLGIYEMLRRRVKLIVAADAGCDPQFRFDDLLNLQSKARADLGVEIEIPPGALDALRQRDARGLSRRQLDSWRVVYARDANGAPSEVGWLVYCKNSLADDADQDLIDYQRRVPSFPHLSTLNQWFAESTFEAYRALGLHLGRKAAARFSEILSARIVDHQIQP